MHTLYKKNIIENSELNIFMDPDVNLKYYWKIKRDIEKRNHSLEKIIDNIKKREN